MYATNGLCIDDKYWPGQVGIGITYVRRNFVFSRAWANRENGIHQKPSRPSRLKQNECEIGEINGIQNYMILNDEVASHAIMKRATKNYAVVIKPRISG